MTAPSHLLGTSLPSPPLHVHRRSVGNWEITDGDNSRYRPQAAHPLLIRYHSTAFTKALNHVSQLFSSPSNQTQTPSPSPHLQVSPPRFMIPALVLTCMPQCRVSGTISHSTRNLIYSPCLHPKHVAFLNNIDESRLSAAKVSVFPLIDEVETNSLSHSRPSRPLLAAYELSPDRNRGWGRRWGGPMG